MTVSDILNRIKESYERILQEKLVGIYVHGSIAFGCFTWEKSDIDFLAVVYEPLTREEKESIISELLDLDKLCPPKGLEMSVVQKKFCDPFVYPTPYELHYSNDHKERFLSHFHEQCEGLHGTDKDLAAHFTVARACGIALCGKEIRDVFGEIPRACYLDSIIFDIENADGDIEENPVYFILNICRAWAFLREGLVLSKKGGGEWGRANLPERYGTLIESALADYAADGIFEPCKQMHDFANNMLNMIRKEMET